MQPYGDGLTLDRGVDGDLGLRLLVRLGCWLDITLFLLTLATVFRPMLCWLAFYFTLPSFVALNSLPGERTLTLGVFTALIVIPSYIYRFSVYFPFNYTSVLS